MKTSEIHAQKFDVWEEIRPGDELVWLNNGKLTQFRAMFISRDYMGMHGEMLNAPKGSGRTIGAIEILDNSIYPSQRTSDLIVGWMKVTPPELKYDPNQQGDTDEDI